MDNFIGEEYYKDPDSVKFLDKYITFNPMHSKLQDAATKASILAIGQKDPIYMLNGLCIDGRHRVKIAKELDTHVKCVDVNPMLNEQVLIKLCNVNTTSGRDFTTAQKAIQALRLVTDFKFKVTEAAEAMKVARKFVSYASTIRGFGRQDVLDALLDDKEVLLEGMKYPSKSLELLCKYVKVEAELGKVIEDTSNRYDYNPDSFIKTEMGKAWFYERKERYGLDDDRHSGVILDLMELANYKFKLVDNDGGKDTIVD